MIYRKMTLRLANDILEQLENDLEIGLKEVIELEGIKFYLNKERLKRDIQDVKTWLNELYWKAKAYQEVNI